MNTSSCIGTDSISFNETSIKSIIAFLLEKDENLIESSNNQMADKKINLNFKNYLKDNSGNKRVILKTLSQVYDFNIENDKRQQEIWELHLLDSLMLLKHKSNTSGNSSSTRISSKEIKIENADLVQVAQTLTSNYNKFITNNTGINSKFDFMFPKKDFIELGKLLNSQYGLSLQKTEKELEYANINFSKVK